MKYRWLTVKRRLLQSREFEQPFADLIRQAIPAPGTAFKDAEIVSLDIETTGLDAVSADMLSVGWVLIRDGRVDLSSARTYMVRPSGDVGDSASVHGLTDTMVGFGNEWAVILSKVVEVLTGRVLLVHHAGLDKTLLDRMCKRHFGGRLLVPVIDTLALEHQRQQRRHHIDEKKSLRLADLRARYNLPRYDAHDCLVDAIATAELLIAMVAHYDGAARTCLRDLCE
ncbi:MAG: exonuclease domain-containing protein [Woeseiaceae bacterium]|jgi:DNA polymerase-3 subunit epsilon